MDIQIFLISILTIVGFKFILPLLLILWKHLILLKLLNTTGYLKNLGKWAVITGATDGIGKEYARALAKRGINLVLISRSQDKLDITANEIKSESCVELETIAADFTKVDIYDSIQHVVKDKDIGILINNVGMTQVIPDCLYTYDTENEFFSKMMNCNVYSAIRMSFIILGGMKDRNRGLIINICSQSSQQPMPLAAMYSSSKRSLEVFSESISQELKFCGSKVRVQTVLPAFVLTKFIGNFKPMRLFSPTAEEYVGQAVQLAAVESYSFGCLCHTIQSYIVMILPQWIRTNIGYRIQKIRRETILKMN